jgi:hypothetical protein
LGGDGVAKEEEGREEGRRGQDVCAAMGDLAEVATKEEPGPPEEEEETVCCSQVSVIQRAPERRPLGRPFPASFTTCTVPFKKRDSSKEWAPYCLKLCLALDPPSFALTTEEKLYIDRRVAETR